MLIVWAACRVTDPDTFVPPGPVPGLLERCGGWSRKDPTLAHLVSRWADEESYFAFVAAAPESTAGFRADTFTELDVQLFDGDVMPDIDDVDPEPAWAV